jgi:sulfoxide reductase heme-binding subunit YedZ
LIYISAICGVIHYWWLVKTGVHTPMTYTLILAALLLFRIVWSFTKTRGKTVVARAATPATSS